ncbi:MAG: hypothetical protein KR126chlam4_00927 [Candidatus Anoxychlamydiales bacterium]|nr:hypothetical protein [Candidatus Anoxychlamydiales bacterium]NGX41091.1 hypothetical protein [Candidatus Anoxychlamydiales bacterium]
METKPLLSLESLPNEILLKILKQDLDITDLKAVRTLGRLWYRLASIDELWINIAKKINYNQMPLKGKSMMSLIRLHVKFLIIGARVCNTIFFEGAFLRNWVNKNIKNDADITIEKILQLKKERNIERVWNRISVSAQERMSFILWI